MSPCGVVPPTVILCAGSGGQHWVVGTLHMVFCNGRRTCQHTEPGNKDEGTKDGGKKISQFATLTDVKLLKEMQFEFQMTYSDKLKRTNLALI